MNSLTSLPSPRLDDLTPQLLASYFENAWQLEDTLLQSIPSAETFYLNPDKLRNPLIFYLGHSVVFYINKLIQVGLLTSRINPEYEILFEIGVDPETPEELDSAIQHINWPSIEQVWQYREKIFPLLKTVIATISMDYPITQDHPIWAILMGIEHQRIHIETSSMLIRQLPVDQVKRPDCWQDSPRYSQPFKSQMVEIQGGKVSLGKPQDFPLYGWDSEYGQIERDVPSFRASNFLITHQDYLEFVTDGGYKNPDYWTALSWQWKQQNNSHHPKFWLLQDNNYFYRSLFEWIPLPLDWPVEVNYYEAMAYCRWQGSTFRLMTEAEWLLATYNSQDNFDCLNPQDTTPYNLNLRWGSPSPVGMAENAQNPLQLYDLRGNVWQWLETTFEPFPQFQPHPLYSDFSQPFFDNQHKMMVGGSWITQGTQALRFYRNWFRPYFYQHAGFRLAQSIH